MDDVTTVSRVSGKPNDLVKEKVLKPIFPIWNVPLKQQRKLFSKFIKTRMSSLILAILLLSFEATPI